ncbi:transcription factor 21 isoform X2 [Prorops nasuta]|uniref:transcription factor 21 isoform X2 n=1 Tax=Prorops nasuta TaxID=863751 RepID=UPI0034CF2CB9
MKRCAASPVIQMEEDDYSDEKCDDGNRAPRNAANARERARMRVLSKAFCRLKTTLPWVPADTKLSKLDTLRLAATYIAHLRAVLRDDTHHHAHPDSTRSLSMALSWPFAIQSNNASILMSSSCGVSSTSSTTSNQYKSQAGSHEIQDFHHSSNHETQSMRHNHVRETHQLSYF